MGKNNKVKRTIKKEELQSVLKTMEFYKRTNGFMDFEGGDHKNGKLVYFDSDPKYFGLGAVKVSMGSLLEWIMVTKS